MKQAVLVLYTELAGYTIACLEALAESGTEVHVVRWPVNSEAPFKFKFSDNSLVYDRKDLSDKQLLELAERINPDLILCSGWNDKGYLNTCKAWRKRIPVVLAMDNKWEGGMKQQLARIVSRFTILNYFSHCWVPGNSQREYARKLGFDSDEIKTGFYTCDTKWFSDVFTETAPLKKQKFPHVFIYAGRYYDFKGVTEMWSAFTRLKKETPNDWKMLSLGVGDVAPLQHPDITHMGFVQPDELPAVMQRSGVFILPSRFEPWAVAVQEFAAAGFPLLLSEAVGAKEAFLKEGENGFSFASNNEDAILSAMKKIVSLTDTQLLEMGDASHNLAVKNTPGLWANTLLSFMTKS